MASKGKKGKDDGKKTELKRVKIKLDLPRDDPLDDPNLYINREIAWVRFNKRILEEAEDRSHPILERIKLS